MNVLYIAGNVGEADVIRVALSKTTPNFKLDCVSTGDVSERLQQPSPYDVVLVDWQLPKNEAPALIKRIRHMDGRMVIVVVAAPAGRPISLEALRCGADDYVTRNEQFVASVPMALQQVLERVNGEASLSNPIRVLYGGDIDFARRHLTSAPAQLRLATPPDGKSLVPQFITPGLTLPYDVLMVEHAFEEFDVFETLKELRTRQLDCPVVVVHRAGDEEIACEALRFGAVDSVIKDENSFKILQVRLAHVVRRSRLLRDHAKLLQSEADLRAILDNLPTGVMKVSRDGKIRALNGAGRSIFAGPETSELIGSSLYSRLVSEDREKMRNAMRAVSDGHPQELEVKLEAPDTGVPSALRIRAVPLRVREEPPSMLASVDCISLDLPQRTADAEVQCEERADHAHQVVEARTEYTEELQEPGFDRPAAALPPQENPPATSSEAPAPSFDDLTVLLLERLMNTPPL